MGRARQDRPITYLSPKIASLDATAMIASAFTYASTVNLMAGTHTGSIKMTIPAGKSCVGSQAAVFKLRDTSTTDDTVVLLDDARCEGFTVDANVPARQAMGFSGFTHGIRFSDTDNVVVRNMLVRNAGETDAAQRAVGIFAERSDGSTQDVEGWVIEGNTIEDSNYILPFGIRARTSFTEGVPRGSQGYVLKNGVIDSNLVIGTNKNQIEIVGPDTRDILVRANTGRHAGGQGGIEADFGPVNITFEDNIVEQIGENGVQTRTIDAFSARCGEYNDGTPGLAPINIVFENNIVRDSVQRNANFIRASQDFGSTGSVWIGHQIVNVTKAPGASADRIIGYALDDKLRAVDGSTVTAPQMDTADILARKEEGTSGYTDLLFNMTAAQISRVQAESPELNAATFNELGA